MLKRIKLIQGVGNFTQTRASGIELTEVTVIYGENRYGKSTLCDILHSLAEDEPSYIIDRQTIPSDSTKPAKIEFMFGTATGNIISTFENGQWKIKSPDCSRLYVFDHDFIHRNVITGQKQERPNSENMTSFILGESNTALFATLAEKNNNLREERRLLSNIEEKLTSHSIANISTYANSGLPTETKEELKKRLTNYTESKQQVIKTIQNIDKIKQRNILGPVGTQVNFNPICESINSILATSLKNIHQDSLLALQNHMANHINDSTSFKDWANKGIAQIKDTCPFCGQVLNEEAQSLITAYQQTFDSEFNKFNYQVRQDLNNLRQPFIIPNTRNSLVQQHQANRQLFELYSESEITGNQSISSLTINLEEKYEFILSSFDDLILKCQQATEYWTPKLEKKFTAPYESSTAIIFEDLNDYTTIYNKAIQDYQIIAHQINDIFNSYKDSLNEEDLNTQKSLIEHLQMEDQSALKRIELEPICVQYRDKFASVNNLDSEYKLQKQELEQSQTTYLNNYFTLINGLFHQLGSSDFEIIKVANNRGKQIIYDLRVKFRGEDISADKINTVFSESDRRALALCIFLAKIISLTTEERSKAILVLDDPVTSFDNERIALILNKLDELQRTIKQLIITTHYKGMATKATKKFRRCAKSLKLDRNTETCLINAIDLDEMMATDHDIAFDRIKAFVNHETNDNILTSLRPFFENEIRHRFKKQLLDLGKSKEDLSICITALRDNGHITSELEARLSAIRDTLNTPMHELGFNALEDTRALADQIISVIYNEL